MLDNTITLSVDEENDGTGNVDHVFTRQEEYLNRTLYVGDGNLPGENRNTVGFYRTAPKPSGNFKGTKKTAMKLTRDSSVTAVDGSTIVAPRIWEISCSLPVGVAAADILLDRQTLIAALDDDDLMDALNIGQSI